MVEHHFRWDFIGLSTDSKPIPATSSKVVDGSTYYTSDDSKLYIWYKDQWYEKEANGSSDTSKIFSGGNNLADKYTLEQLSEKISTGDFSGINIGDYITKTVKVGSNVERELDFVVAAFDYFYNYGDTALETHHIVFVPTTNFYEQEKMNTANTATSGYYGTEMHGICSVAYTAGTGGTLSNPFGDYEVFKDSSLEPDDGIYEFVRSDGQWTYNSESVGANLTDYGIRYTGTPVDGDTLTVTFNKGYLEPYREAIYTAFGKNHILPFRNSVTVTTTTTAWATSRVELMNESMLYGHVARGLNVFGDLYAKTQLPIFTLQPALMLARQGKDGSRASTWLTTIGSTNAFCYYSLGGSANYGNASVSYGVRPFFLFY